MCGLCDTQKHFRAQQRQSQGLVAPPATPTEFKVLMRTEAKIQQLRTKLLAAKRKRLRSEERKRAAAISAEGSSAALSLSAEGPSSPAALPRDCKVGAHYTTPSKCPLPRWEGA